MTLSTPDVRIAECEAVHLFLGNPCEGTFVAIFRLFAPRILRFFELRGCDRPLAEDLTQETMLAAYRRAGMLRDSENFRAWLFAIGRNTHRMHLRCQGRHAEQVELEVVAETLEAVSLDPFSRSVLSQSLAMLDPGSRHILSLRYLDGLEYHEIAEVLELPLGTVQWKVFNAKKKLAKWLSAGA